MYSNKNLRSLKTASFGDVAIADRALLVGRLLKTLGLSAVALDHRPVAMRLSVSRVLIRLYAGCGIRRPVGIVLVVHVLSSHVWRWERRLCPGGIRSLAAPRVDLRCKSVHLLWETASRNRKDVFTKLPNKLQRFVYFFNHTYAIAIGRYSLCNAMVFHIGSIC